MRRLLLLLSTVTLIFLPASVESRTWYVKVDGTGDAPTIQAAVDSAQDGDEVLVAAGTYTWTNQGTPLNGPMVDISIEVWLHSESGAEATVLNAEDQGGLIQIINETVRIQPVIEGFTLKNGSKDFQGSGAAILCGYCDPTIKDNIIIDNWTMYYGGPIFLYDSDSVIEGNYFARNVSAAGWGGAICSWTDSDPIIIDNIFDDNFAQEEGGAIYCYGASPTITNNVIAWNRAIYEFGGGIYCRHYSSEIVNNTLVGNRSTVGAAIYLEDCSPAISNNIIADSRDGTAVYCDSTSSPSITCNDFWANTAGDGNCTLGSDNFSADPMFCNEASEDFSLHKDSPCASANSPAGCGLVGALPVGCWSTSISGAALAILVTSLLAVAVWTIRRRRYQVQ